MYELTTTHGHEHHEHEKHKAETNTRKSEGPRGTQGQGEHKLITMETQGRDKHEGGPSEGNTDINCGESGVHRNQLVGDTGRTQKSIVCRAHTEINCGEAGAGTHRNNWGGQGLTQKSIRHRSGAHKN